MNARTLDRPPPARAARQALRFVLALIAVTVGGAIAMFGGCVLPTNGLPNPDAGEGGGVPMMSCEVNSQCMIEDPCMVGTCGPDQICVFTNLVDGPAPATAQTPGNCTQVVCKSGEPMNEPDPTNLPTNANDCKTAGCNGEMPFLNPKTDGTPCVATTPTGETAGTCMFGQCSVMCGPMMACPDMGPCQITSCDANTGTCVNTNVPDDTPTPHVTQTPGTCMINECVQGKAMDVDDPGNLPTAPNDCQTPTCTSGTPSLPPVAKDQLCSTFMGDKSGFCDGAGSCVQCNEDSECSGMANDCEHPSCASHACGTTFTPSGTPTTTTPAQTAGDCKQVQCNGTGGTMTVNDDSDLPGNGTCTTGTCTSGNAGQSNDPDGTPCGNGLSCKSVMCNGCTTDAMCATMSMPNAKCSVPNCTCAPSTCAGLGKTCGSFPDGCGGMLNCSGAQSGMETDVDCGGPVAACATRCPQADKCLVNSDCATGFCADGVCCNKACNTTCEACTAAKKGSGSDGVCGGIKAGTDPDSQCAMQSMMSCSVNGTGCNGNGACNEWPTGTVCKAPSCSGTVLTAAETCNGSGTCSTATPMDCTPNQCTTGGNGGCTSGCSSDANCGPNGYCLGAMCALKGSPATPCTAPDQCLSGFCVNGFCCSSACNGACQACAAAAKQSNSGTGTCGAALSGTVCAAQSCTGSTLTNAKTCNSSGTCQGGAMTPCGEYVCNMGGTACDSTCATDAQCVAGAYCNGGVCTPKGASGAACNQATFMGDDCTSGTCVDGVCCNSACNGTCMACTLALTGSPNGTCAAVTSGTAAPSGQCTASPPCGNTGNCAAGGVCQQVASGMSCGSASCSSGQLTMGGTCNGTGSCASGSMGACPGGFICANGTTCKTACGSDGDCELSTSYCMSPGSSGTCVAMGGTGTPCSAPDQCSNNLCVDGFCCNVACTSACMACAASLQASGGGGNGTCSPSTNGMASPAGHTTCTAASMMSCGLDGKCNGGMCEDWNNTTPCAAASCTPGTSGGAASATAAMTCSGSGSCNQGGTVSSCAPYAICNMTACATTCAMPSDCMSGYTCMTNTCLGNPGTACTAPDQCSSGMCTQPDAGAAGTCM